LLITGLYLKSKLSTTYRVTLYKHKNNPSMQSVYYGAVPTCSK